MSLILKTLPDVDFPQSWSHELVLWKEVSVVGCML